MAAIASALLNAARYIPASQILKALSKKIPKLGKFIDSSLASGFTGAQIADFFSSSAQDKSFLRNLDQMYAENKLTAPERMLRRKEKTSQGIQRFATDLAGFGIGSLLGGVKEQETQPEKKDFRETAKNVGNVAAQAGIAQPRQQEMPQPQQRVSEQIVATAPERGEYNPLSALAKFPRLYRFIGEKAKAGMGVEEIVRRARGIVPLRMDIERIESDIDEPFESWISRIIGGSQQARQQPVQQMQQPSMDLEAKKARAMQLMEMLSRQRGMNG